MLQYVRNFGYRRLTTVEPYIKIVLRFATEEKSIKQEIPGKTKKACFPTADFQSYKSGVVNVLFK